MEENKITFMSLYESIQEVMNNVELSEREKMAQIKDLTNSHNLIDIPKDKDVITETSSIIPLLNESHPEVEQISHTSLMPRLYHGKGKYGDISVNISSGHTLFVPSRTHTLLFEFSNGLFFGVAYEITAAELVDLLMKANLPKVERLKRL